MTEHHPMSRFDLNNLPRCGAKTRTGTPCQHLGNARNGRCRLHGGASTGPKTKEGRRKCGDPHRQGKGHSRQWKEFRWAVRASMDLLNALEPTEDTPKQRRTAARVQKRVQRLGADGLIQRVRKALNLRGEPED